MEALYKSHAGNLVYAVPDGIIIELKRDMMAYSTSPMNGGIQPLRHIFNHQLTTWVDTAADLPGGSTMSYLQGVARGYGLPVDQTSGLMTTASMKNAAIVAHSFQEVSLFAVVTAGTAANAARAGEPGIYYEKITGSFIPVHGTINIILVLEFALPVESLARTPVIVTEAKCAALHDLAVPSCFSGGIATGTGTDGVVVACKRTGPPAFTDVGTHSKVGELIARAVMDAMHRSLCLEAASSDRVRNTG